MWLNIAAAFYLSTGWLNNFPQNLGYAERGATGASKPNDHCQPARTTANAECCESCAKKIQRRCFTTRIFNADVSESCCEFSRKLSDTSALKMRVVKQRL